MDLQELEKTARLAHLNFSKDELVSAFPAFEQMIGFFAVMQETDSDTAFFQQNNIKTEYFRADDCDVDPFPERNSSFNEKMLKAAGERDGRFFVIPNVLEAPL